MEDNKIDVIDELQTLTKKAIKDNPNTPTTASKHSKRFGRPKGTVKRKEGTSNLVIPLSISDKQWVQATAQSRGISMTDLITGLIDKERTRTEKYQPKI